VDTNNIFYFIWAKKDMYLKKKSTIIANYKYFFPRSSLGYEYSNFQFLKHDGYAQRLCMQNVQI